MFNLLKFFHERNTLRVEVMNELIIRCDDGNHKKTTRNKLIHLPSDLHQEHTPNRLSTRFAVLFVFAVSRSLWRRRCIWFSRCLLSASCDLAQHTRSFFLNNVSRDKCRNVSTVVGSTLSFKFTAHRSHFLSNIRQLKHQLGIVPLSCFHVREGAKNLEEKNSEKPQNF